MNPIKMNLALAALAGVLAAPAAQNLFAADKPAEAPASAARADSDSDVNKLTDAENAAGWKLLFNGKDAEGWHSFKRKDVLPAWKVAAGALACVDPHNAGDRSTTDQDSTSALT